MELTSITPGPEGLRALSHPVRLRILGLLRTDGPATATSLAQRLELNSGATSYHLRQLAQHGFIEEDAERGNARDRWWRAAHQSTLTRPHEAASPGEQDTYDAYLQSVAIVYTRQLQRALEERRTLPVEWQRAGTFSDWELRLSPARAAALRDALAQVLTDFEEDPEDAPQAATYVVNINAYLRPGDSGS